MAERVLPSDQFNILFLFSYRYWVHIHVEEINLHAPEWPKESYLVKVLEGRIYDKIIQVKATDKDVSQDYHTICSYHILTPQVPFSISKTGKSYTLPSAPTTSSHHKFPSQSAKLVSHTPYHLLLPHPHATSSLLNQQNW